SAVGVRKAGLPVEQVIALQHGQPTGNTRLDAVLNFSLAVIAHRGAVSDIELQAFLDSGFTQEQALEVVLGVSLATLCNFANSLAQSPVNPQLEAFRAGVLKA